ncbi:MAG: hypothetical protein J0M30_01415 [Chitinophagales bacterium]|nr:hypothetical protein [Chitinophagales bacterium]
MKKVYIISYDLKNPGQNYEKILALIKSFGKWARLGGSAYLIVSTQTAVQVRDNLKTALDSNDKLFVGTLTLPAAWVGMPDEVSNWIRNNLTE